MKLQVVKSQNNSYYATPKCLQSERMCRLVNQPYLTGEQVKLIELMGFKVEYQEKI